MNELEKRILEAPEIEAFLAYGDWLADRGDPRGELVTVQTALMKNPTDRTLRQREAALLTAHAAAWLGPLRGLPRDDFSCTWSCGFIDWVQLGGDHPEALVAQLFALPHLSFLRRVTLASLTRDFSPAIAALAANLPAGVGTLAIRWTGPGLWWGRGRARADGLEHPAFEQLTALSLFVHQASLARVELPNLRTAAIECPSLTARDVAAIGEWHALERLEIVGGEDAEGRIPYDALAPLYRLPALRHLGLTEWPAVDELLDRIASTELLDRLESVPRSLGGPPHRGRRRDDRAPRRCVRAARGDRPRRHALRGCRRASRATRGVRQHQLRRLAHALHGRRRRLARLAGGRLLERA